MTEHEKNIDKLFQTKLNKAEIQPPSDSWMNISAELSRRKSIKTVLLFQRIAAGIAILIAGTVAFFYFNQNLIDSESYAEDRVSSQNYKSITDNEGIENVQESGHQSKASSPALATKNANQSSEKQIILSDDTSRGESLIQNQAVESNLVNNNKITLASLPLARSQVSVQDITYEDNASTMATDNSPKINLKLLQPRQNLLSAAQPINVEEIIVDPVKEEDRNLSLVVKPEKQKENWQLGAFYAPLYSYRVMNSEIFSSVQKEIIDNSERGKISYSGGVMVSYKLGRRLKISSGINYTKMSNAIENTVAYASHYSTDGESWAPAERTTKVSYQVNNSIGQIETGTSETRVTSNDFASNPGFYGDYASALNTTIINSSSDIVQNFSYLEIPVIFKYSVIQSALNINFLTGISSYLLVDNEVLFQNINGAQVSGSTKNIRTSSLSGALGLGLAYGVSKNVNLYIDPLIKFFLNSINTSDAISTYPYSFGIYSGLSFQF